MEAESKPFLFRAARTEVQLQKLSLAIKHSFVPLLGFRV